MGVLERNLVRNFLNKREPLIPHKKLVDSLDLSRFIKGSPFSGQAVELPNGVTPEQAIETVSRSDWAKNLASGVCGTGYAGFAPGTPEFEHCVFNVSHRVAAKVLGLTWTPSAPAGPARRR